MKRRLDVLLVERGLATTRSQAQALVMAGRVRGYEKAGTAVEETAPLELTAVPRFVSRGGEKLRRALDTFGLDVAGRDCLDLGASTGGFTDCLLQAGARRVCTVDVGRAQLHERLRADARVTVREETNARDLGPEQLPFTPDVVTADVSFISLRLVLPPALRCAAPGWRALALVKPQFEAGRTAVRGGVVRDPSVHRRVLGEITAIAQRGWGARVSGICDSGLPGPKGNREFFLLLASDDQPTDGPTIDAWIDDAVG